MQESTDVWVWRGVHRVHHMRSAQTLTHCVYVCAICTYVFFVLGSEACQFSIKTFNDIIWLTYGRSAMPPLILIFPHKVWMEPGPAGKNLNPARIWTQVTWYKDESCMLPKYVLNNYDF